MFQDKRQHPLKVAAEAALKTPREEMSGQCGFCSTDSLRRSIPERVIVPQEMSRNHYWMSHVNLLRNV